MNPAMVIGSEGQDGRLLCGRLQAEGRDLVALDQGTLRAPAGLDVPPTDILDAAAVERAVERSRPAEVYYLAAYHHSSEDLPAGGDLEVMERSYAVHVRGLLHVLEAIRRRSPASRLFYAASSLIFGEPAAAPQDEATPIAPVCAYGISKAAGVHCCRLWRAKHGVFASAGILYTHESPRRGEAFVAQKIIRGALRIQRGTQDRLVLGDLSAAVDWGYAPDTVDAMCRILRLEKADDFVVATGEAHMVGEFVELAFGLLGLDWRRHVEEKPSVLRRRRMNLVGDAGKLRGLAGWGPSVSFQEMVGLLVRAAQEAE